jgi:hypothetical protein
MLDEVKLVQVLQQIQINSNLAKQSPCLRKQEKKNNYFATNLTKPKSRYSDLKMNPTLVSLVSISILVLVGSVDSTHEKSIIKYLGTDFLVRIHKFQTSGLCTLGLIRPKICKLPN